jgi:hypothetical protein
MRFRRKRCNTGQATTEFMVMTAMMIGVILALVLFLAVFHEWGWRVLNIIGLEYP